MAFLLRILPCILYNTENVMYNLRKSVIKNLNHMHLKVRPLSLLYIHDINYSISLFYQGSIGENIYSMNKSKFY